MIRNWNTPQTSGHSVQLPGTTSLWHLGGQYTYRFVGKGAYHMIDIIIKAVLHQFFHICGLTCTGRTSHKHL